MGTKTLVGTPDPEPPQQPFVSTTTWSTAGHHGLSCTVNVAWPVYK